VIDLLGCNWCAVICIKIGRGANIWIFSESSTGAKGNGYGSKSKLFHFLSPWFCEATLCSSFR
jgi:ribonuclease HII